MHWTDLDEYEVERPVANLATLKARCAELIDGIEWVEEQVNTCDVDEIEFALQELESMQRDVGKLFDLVQEIQDCLKPPERINDFD